MREAEKGASREGSKLRGEVLIGVLSGATRKAPKVLVLAMVFLPQTKEGFFYGPGLVQMMGQAHQVSWT